MQTLRATSRGRWLVAITLLVLLAGREFSSANSSAASDESLPATVERLDRAAKAMEAQLAELASRAPGSSLSALSALQARLDDLERTVKASAAPAVPTIELSNLSASIAEHAARLKAVEARSDANRGPSAVGDLGKFVTVESGALGGTLRIKNAADKQVALLTTSTASNGLLELRTSQGDVMTTIGSVQGQGDTPLLVMMGGGVQRIRMQPNAYGGEFTLNNTTGTKVANLEVGRTEGGVLTLHDKSGKQVVYIGMNTQGNGLLLIDGKKVGDVAEAFRLSGEAGPGTVVVMDPTSPGRVMACSGAYDNKVVGVVQGAGDLEGGILLGVDVESGRTLPVALLGQVYCLVDATGGSIEVGDLLTTSGTVGCAERASDPARSRGAVLGKAMEGLRTGRGQIRVLLGAQ